MIYKFIANLQLFLSDLIKESYSIGRAEECSITLNDETDQNFLLYSKKHFEICRVIKIFFTIEHLFQISYLTCRKN